MYWVRVVGLLVITLLLGACASRGVDLVGNGTTEVMTSDSDKGKVVAPKVEQYGDSVLVRGRVANVSEGRILKGAVSVDLFDARGVRIDTVDTRYRFRHNASTVSRTAPFTARLHIVPPQGSKVVINHEDKRPTGGQTQDGKLSIM